MLVIAARDSMDGRILWLHANLDLRVQRKDNLEGET